MTRQVLSIRRYLQPNGSTSAAQIAGHIGRPSIGDLIDDTIDLAGWCASPQRRLVRLIVYVGTEKSEFDIAVPSEDVAANQPELIGADACRFKFAITVAATPRAQVVGVYAVDERGQLSPFADILLSQPLPRDESVLSGPVFVVGSPRSGTTILGNTIRYSLGLTGFDESHVMPLLTHLRNAAKAFYESPHYAQMQATNGTMISRVPLTLVESGLAQLFRDLYAALHGNNAFVDKNPGPDMLRAAPWLLLAWPNARFVFAKRRAIENLVSRQRKFGFDAKNFRTHCKDWSETMMLGLRVRTLIQDSQWIEIEQQDVAHDHEAVAERLASFLGLPDRAPQFAHYIATHTPQKTTSDSWKTLNLSKVGWDEGSISIFQEECMPMMNAWGYTTDESYATPRSA